MDCQPDTTQHADLAALIKQESAAIETMLTLSHQLQECLVRFDSTGIEQLARQQESILNTLQTYEHTRWQLIAERFGIPIERAKALTFSQLLAMLSPDEQEKLSACYQRLRDCLSQLQLANSINRMLALRGRNSIQTTVAFVQERNLHAINTAL